MPNEDARLFDYRVKRGLDEVSGGGATSSSAPQRSKIFGAWTAEHCDRARHPAMANLRDLQVFKKLLYADMICDEAEVYGAFVALTKKGAKELNERRATLLVHEEEGGRGGFQSLPSKQGPRLWNALQPKTKRLAGAKLQAIGEI